MERLFNLDGQFLFDAAVLGVSMLVLFVFLSYFLFEPVRNLLEKRRERVVAEQEEAKQKNNEAAVFKEEYEEKLRNIDKEVEMILGDARKKAQKNESKIIAEAKEEAARIIDRARGEIELEKKRAVDEVKQDLIAISSLMASKVVSAAIDVKVQDSLIEETLKEMGESTWQS